MVQLPSAGMIATVSFSLVYFEALAIWLPAAQPDDVVDGLLLRCLANVKQPLA